MQIINNKNIILASASPVRKKLLNNLGLNFKVLEPDFDEEKAKDEIKHLSIKDQAIFLAQNKAISISKKYPDEIIIAADQICEINQLPISKSRNEQEAISQIKTLSGNIHFQNNVTTIYLNQKNLLTNYQKVKLQMRDLTNAEIKSYVKKDKSWNCAGSYKFESLGKHLFENVEGDHDCVLGLNVIAILSFLFKNQYINII